MRQGQDNSLTVKNHSQLFHLNAFVKLISQSINRLINFFCAKFLHHIKRHGKIEAVRHSTSTSTSWFSPFICHTQFGNGLPESHWLEFTPLCFLITILNSNTQLPSYHLRNSLPPDFVPTFSTQFKSLCCVTNVDSFFGVNVCHTSQTWCSILWLFKWKNPPV